MSPPQGTLFVVATPIGNLEDFSPRAVRTLAGADALYAEDTRRSRILLDHFGVAKPLRSLYEHNERARVGEVLAALARGDCIAIMTDAGTPAVSDPGAAVVAEAAAAGFTVCPIPGPSALTTALSAAGFEAGEAGVLFVGFLPSRGSGRTDAIMRVSAHTGTVVLFEAPHRLQETLQELAAIAPQRRAVVARELTKMHEELWRGTLSTLAIGAEGKARGEISIVLDSLPPTPVVPPEDVALDGMLDRCLTAGLSARDAATAVAAVTNQPRRAIYARCQALRPKS